MAKKPMKSIWDISLESANLMYFWASIAAIGLGALTVLAAVLTFWASGVREKHSDRVIEQARATAAQAHERTADIEQRNLKLEIELEKERLKRDELQLRLGPRMLTPLQAEKIKLALSSVLPNKITVTLYQSHDIESKNYAEQIAAVLCKCNVDVRRIHGHITMSSRPTVGVALTILGGYGNQLIHQALEESGVATDIHIVPPPRSASDAPFLGFPYDECAASINVMAKPPSIYAYR